METSEDKQWASRYLLDPLTAPEPSQEDGPGTHYGSTFAPASEDKSSIKSNGHSDKNVNADVRPVSNHRQALRNSHMRSSSLGRPSTEIPTSSARDSVDGTRSRGSSLGTRYPGDESNRPLDVIRRDSKKANRSPHLRKKQHIGVDQIDKLDSVGPSLYHHGSAYDAASLARNRNPRDGPVWAVSSTNREALKATPREKVIDSLKSHRPLDGVAMTPPGLPDSDGRVLNYEEGADMMIEHGGNYKRWPGVDYHPDDLKGKGEPSFTIERALKGHNSSHRHHVSDGGVELAQRSRRRSDGPPTATSSGAATHGAGAPRRESGGHATGIRQASVGQEDAGSTQQSQVIRRKKVPEPQAG